MNRTVKMLAVSTLTLGVGLAAGFALGQRQGLGMGLGFLQSEVTFSLATHVEAASCVRVGDTDRALALLDGLIDSAVVNVRAQPGPLQSARSMSQAKVYRSVVPATGPNAAGVRGALESVPDPDGRPYSAAEHQTSGLGRLVARSGR